MKGPRILIEIEGALARSRLFLADTFTVINAPPSILEWLDAYVEGMAAPLNLTAGSPFQQKVMLAIQKIPFGQTVSYGILASLCDQPKGARAVGNACNRNPFPLFVPCHRVIQANGAIGGFAMDLEIKRRLLEFEAGAFPPR